MLGFEWINTIHELPEAGVNVTAYGENSYMKERTMRAFYAPKFTIEDDNEYEAAEYCEESDQYFLKEGWYETNEHEDVHWMIEFPITFWQPLPPAPFSKEQLNAIVSHIPFMPTLYQARYASIDCLLAVKNGERFLTAELLKKFRKKSHTKPTVADIGNVAYVFLRSKDEVERRKAEVELIMLRSNANKDLAQKEDYLLDALGMGGFGEINPTFLKKK
jgi:hypothetical protein